MTARTLALLIPALGWLLGCTPGDEPLSNEEAQELIELQWNRPDVGLLLGDIAFVDGPTEAAKGREALKELPLYRAFASEGLIRISGERDLATNSGNWKGYDSLVASGIRRIIRVDVTEEGRKRGLIGQVGTFSELLLNVVESRVERIEANDSLRLGGTRYHAVSGLHRLTVPPEAKAALEEARGSMDPERRFKILLKYDARNKIWVVDAMDTSLRSQAYANNNVDNRIAQLRRGRPGQ